MAAVELNASHKEMVFKYLRFAAVQRNQQLKELKIALTDFKKSRLNGDDMFSTDEVTEMVDEIGGTFQADTVRDLQRVAHATVVLLQQVVSQAEARNVSISIDTSLLEDELLLNAAAEMEKASEKPIPQTALESAPSLKQMKLASLDSSKQAMSLEVELAQVKERMRDLQQELTGINREKTSLKEALVASEAKAASLFEFANARAGSDTAALVEMAGSSAHGGGVEVLGEIVGGLAQAAASKLSPIGLAPVGVEENKAGGGAMAGEALRVKELEKLVGELQAKVDAKSREAETKAKEAAHLEVVLQDKLDKAPQFKSLKDMLGKKNGQLRDFRERLKGFGWVDPDESQ